MALEPLATDNELIPPGSPSTVIASSEGAELLIRRVKDWYRQAADHWGDWRAEAVEDFAFVSGDQWATQDMAVLEEQERPAIVFNRVGPVIDAIGGLEANNRQEVRYIPREPSDTGIADLYTAASEWARDLCDAGEEESDAFLDCTICGLGWTETRMDYADDEDGRVIVGRVDPLQMFPDPNATKRNIADARWLLRIKQIDIEDAKQTWPEHADALDMAKDWPGVSDDPREPHDAFDAKFYRNDNRPGDERRGKFGLVECQWWDYETVYRVADPGTGELVSVNESRFKEIKAIYRDLEKTEPRGVKQRQRHFYRAFFAGDLVLEVTDGPCEESFTYKAITGRRDRNKGTWYGMVRAMKDPQRWSNKWMSQILHIINTNASGGIVAEQDAFENPRQAEEDWARPDGITWARPGAIRENKIMPKPVTQFPASLPQLLEFAISSIRDVTGVNLELMGLADRQQAGVLEYQRKQAGMTILATLFDNLRRYRKEQGRVLLYFLRTYIADGRLIRIDSENGPQYQQLIADDSVTTYDIIVDEAPSAPNQKERVWQLLTQILPILAKQPMPTAMWAELLKYSPLPASLGQKMGQILTEADQRAQQAQQPMQQLAMQQAEADIEHTKGQAADEATRAQLNLAKAGKEQIEAVRPPPRNNGGV